MGEEDGRWMKTVATSSVTPPFPSGAKPSLQSEIASGSTPNNELPQSSKKKAARRIPFFISPHHQSD
jgi:hypothetical protein